MRQGRGFEKAYALLLVALSGASCTAILGIGGDFTQGSGGSGAGSTGTAGSSGTVGTASSANGGGGSNANGGGGAGTGAAQGGGGTMTSTTGTTGTSGGGGAGGCSDPDCTGFDCGFQIVCGTSVTCGTCPTGKTCSATATQTAGVCNGCSAPTCGSQGFNCGILTNTCDGSTSDCGTCAAGNFCQTATPGGDSAGNCKSGCGTDSDCPGGGPCASPRCLNNVCGISPSPDGDGCTGQGGQCEGGVCYCTKNSDCLANPSEAGCDFATLTCTNPASCNDGLLDGSESDVDCGGGSCPVCPSGAQCKVDSDCISNLCLGGTCE